jgi:hypothetical protein
MEKKPALYANEHDDIWCAARRGDSRAVLKFLQRGADANIEDECGNAPLYYGVLYGHIEVAKKLIDFGANIHDIDKISEELYDQLRSYKLGRPITVDKGAAAGPAGSESGEAYDRSEIAQPFDLTPIRLKRRKRTKPTASEALIEARKNMILTRGEEWTKKLEQVAANRESQKERRKWLSQVNRAFWLQQREKHERKWMAKRKMVDAQVRFTDEQRKELRKWFESLDADGSGEISFVELAGPLLSTGIATTQREVQDIIDRHKSDVTGGIDFESFMALLKPAKKINIKKLYERLDKNPLLDVEKLVREAEEEKKNSAARAAFENLKDQLTSAEAENPMDIDSLISFTRREKIMKQLKTSIIRKYESMEQPSDSLATEPTVSPKRLSPPNGLGNSSDPLPSSSPQSTEKTGQSKASEDFQRKLMQRKIARDRLRRLDNLSCLQRVVRGSMESGTRVSYYDGELPPENNDKVRTYEDFDRLLPTLRPPAQLRALQNHRQWDFWLARAKGGTIEYDSEDEEEENFVEEVANQSNSFTRGRSVISEDTEGILKTPVKTRRNTNSTALAQTYSRSPAAVENALSPHQVNIERRFSKFLKPTRADIIRRNKHKVRRQYLKKKKVHLPALGESKSAPKLKANTTYYQQRQTSSGKRRRSNKNNKVGSSASLTTLSTKQPMFAVTVGNGLVNAKIVDLNLSTGFPAKERG